jgi:hypothetical protein
VGAAATAEGSGAAAAAAAEVDEGVMQSLEREVWPADHLAGELQRQKVRWTVGRGGQATSGLPSSCEQVQVQ